MSAILRQLHSSQGLAHLFSRALSTTSTARSSFTGGPMHRAGPPPLPAEDQKEFEELVKAAQRPLSSQKYSGNATEGASQTLDQDALLHPDARRKPAPQFEGDVNPLTGEKGGPKHEPLAWGGEGEWTFGGRATDF